MAGRGPTRKAQAHRRRSEPRPVAPGSGGVEPPKLPHSYAEVVKTDGTRQRVRQRFGAGAREWYRTMQENPIADLLTGSDWQRLIRVAVLVDRFDRTGDEKLLAEIRLQEHGLLRAIAERSQLGLAQRRSAPQDDLARARDERERRELVRRAMEGKC